MGSKIKYRTRLTWLVLAIFCAVLWLSSGNVVVSQPSNVSTQREALSRLSQFKNQVSSLRSVANKPLGPYPIHTRCTWCSERAWWGFGLCTEETTTTWDTEVDFTWTRQRLIGLLEEAEQNANAFLSRYAPTQAWINALPGLSAKFDATADIVLATQNEIKAGIGPNDQQRQTVTVALLELSMDLDRSSSLLQDSTRTLATFLQQQSGYRENVKQAIEGADRSAQVALTSLEDQSKNYRCQDGLKEKYEGIRRDFSNSLQELSGAFQSLEETSKAAEGSLAKLLGLVVNSQTELRTVLSLLNAAGNDKLGSFLEKLHLNSARNQWRNLADAAQSSLSN